jgi:hypothetical protein
VNLVETGDDGAIYVCNLGTSVATFKVYRYETESSVPTTIFNGDPTLNDTNAVVTNSKRFGDNLDVRGVGTNTQIIVNSRGGRASAIISPDPALGLNDTWLAQTIHLDAPNNTTGTGVAWDAGNTYWAKQASNPLRKFQIANPADIGNTSIALVATTVVTFATSTALPATTAGLGALPASNLRAVVDYSSHLVRLFNTSAGLNLENTGAFAAPAAADGNGVGTADFARYGGDTYVYGINVNNGVAAFRVVAVTVPVISGGPANQSILEGGYGSLNVLANGSMPLVYYWYYHGTDGLNTNFYAAVTNSGNLSFTNVTSASAGYYNVVVSNSAGNVASTNALLTIVPTVRTVAMTERWKLPPDSRSYLGTSDLTRGLAVNPINGHVLVVSRVGGAKIYVLDGATGADLWQMNTDPAIVTGSSPAGFELNMIGVADDGVVYACNLNTGGANTKVYRWNDDTTNSAPVAISAGDVGFSGRGRFGDTIAVRGSGATTEILLRSQDQAFSMLLDTFDGANFGSVGLVEDGDDNTRLGVAFGAGATYWSKGTTNLYHFGYDANTGVAGVLEAFDTDHYPTAGYPLGIDVTNHLLAQVATLGQTPDNLRLYDILRSAETNAPVLVDQEFFPSDNGNINAIGAVAFDSARKRVFALNNNNGIIALNYSLSELLTLHGQKSGNDFVSQWLGASYLQSATNVTGPYADIATAASPYTNAISGNQFFRLRR